MYSRPIEKPEIFTIYEIKNNNKTIDYTQLTNIKETALLNSIKNYEESKIATPDYIHEQVLNGRFKNKVSENTFRFLKDGLRNDSDLISKFPSWLNSTIHYTNDSFSIEKNTYGFSDKKLIQTQSILRSNAN